MFLMFLPMITQLVSGLLTEYNLLGGDELDNTIDSAAEGLDSIIDALTRMRNKEPIDLASLKLDETYEQVLARMRSANQPTES